MGRYFALNLAVPQGSKTKNKKIVSTKSFKKLKRLNFGFVLGIFLVLLAIGYMTQVNSLSTKGYEIRKLELALKDIKETGKRLELEAAGLQSIQSIDEDIELLNLIPSGTVKSIPGSDYAYSD